MPRKPAPAGTSKKPVKAGRRRETDRAPRGRVDGTLRPEPRRFLPSRPAMILCGSVVAALLAVFCRNDGADDSAVVENETRRHKADKRTTHKSILVGQDADQRHAIADIGRYYRLLERFEHDSESFTQGLEYDLQNNVFLESTGLYGQSLVRSYEYVEELDDDMGVKTSYIHSQIELSETLFGEGLCSYTNRSHDVNLHRHDPDENADDTQTHVLQLTWKERTALIYKYIPHKRMLKYRHSVTFNTHTGEGWGVAYNPKQHVFYVSDGSHYIHIWNASTLQPVSSMPVTLLILPRRKIKKRQPPFAAVHSDSNREHQHEDEHEDEYEYVPDTDADVEPRPLGRLNELEYDKHTHTLLANVWYEDVVVRIDMNTGQVIRGYSFNKLYPHRPPNADCLNGIAWANKEHTEIYLTGKKWPYMYRVKLLK